MNWEGVGKLAEVEGRMDAKQYMAILEDHLLPSIEESGVSDEDIYKKKFSLQIVGVWSSCSCLESKNLERE